MATFLIYANGKRGDIPEKVFAGNNGVPEEYTTDDPVQIASLMEWDAAALQEGPTGIKLPEATKPRQKVHVGPVGTFQDQPENADADEEDEAEPEEVEEAVVEAEQPVAEAVAAPEAPPRTREQAKEAIVGRLRTFKAEHIAKGEKGYPDSIKQYATKYDVKLFQRKADAIYDDIAERHLAAISENAKGE